MSMVNFTALTRNEVFPLDGERRDQRVMDRAYAVMMQARSALQPFLDIVCHVIRAARERQTRSHVRWEQVKRERLPLDPVDTLIELRGEPPRLVLLGWPADQEIRAGALLQVVSPRSFAVTVQGVEQGQDGPVLRLDEVIHPDDRVWLGGRECRFRLQGSATAPPSVADAAGAVHKVRRVIEKGATVSRLIVEGTGLKLPAGDPERAILESWCDLHAVTDAEGRQHRVDPSSSGLFMLADHRLPDGSLVEGDNGLRFRVRSSGGGGRKLFRIKLLPSAAPDEDETVDPRDAFFMEKLEAVWDHPKRSKANILKVRGADRDEYTLLLEELPTPGSELHLPVDVGALEKQRKALRQLIHDPLPHHRPLLRLAENRVVTIWKTFAPEEPESWITPEMRGNEDGTDEQRRFVSLALATPDFAFLEGPPGSGKTTAICELILQLIRRGGRVLLCSTTHVAVDNVLEKLDGRYDDVQAVRIGNPDRVDDRVQHCLIDDRVADLVAKWRTAPGLAAQGDAELRDMAERTVLTTANLTCGTTTGILQHPLLRGGSQGWDDPLARKPWFDVLIIDEASRATFQEFLVPALLAKRWVVVGDVHQLPPFVERAALEAGLEASGNGLFPAEHQRAAFLARYLETTESNQPRLLAEPAAVAGFLWKECAARKSFADRAVVRIVRGRGGRTEGPCRELGLDDLREGRPAALLAAAADVLILESDLLEDAARWLPGNLPRPGDRLDGTAWAQRHAWALAKRALHFRSYRSRGRWIESPEDEERHEAKQLRDRSWAKEVAWRLTRMHELKCKSSDDEHVRLQEEVAALLPQAADSEEVGRRVQSIGDVGLPGIIETLQEGADPDRVVKLSALSSGMNRSDWESRKVTLSWQHRMDPSISDFPRREFYSGLALKDASTLKGREARVGWSYRTNLPARRVWDPVEGREDRGVNHDEICAMEAWLRDFLAWAELHPRKRGRWEVACLSFYVIQQRGIRDMIRKVTGIHEKETRFLSAGGKVEIVCGTVDRFQGREADFVLLSMRNSGRAGFLNSPNRLNVAITRARFLLVIAGNRKYFEKCGISELKGLAAATPPVIRP